MKKILSIALVALLAASTVFAGISGYGQLGYKYDFDSKDTGFTNDTNIKIDVDVATASEEAIAEGAVYASISGSFRLWAFNGADGAANADPIKTGLDLFGISDVKASINGANWSLNLLEMPGRLDLAKSAIDISTVEDEDDDYGFDKDDYDEAKSYAVSYAKAPGFGFTYNGFEAGFGFFYHDKDATKNKTVLAKDVLEYTKGTKLAAVVKTPEISIIDGLSLQAGLSYYWDDTSTLKAVTDVKKEGPDTKKFGTDKGSAIGGSLAVKYDGDIISANVATDMGYKIRHYDASAAGAVRNEDKEKFGMDIAASVSVSPVTIDAFYQFDGTKKEVVDANYLSAQVGVDLNTFGVPMTLTVYGKDIARPVATIDSTAKMNLFGNEIEGKITKGSEYGIKTSVTPLDALKIDASFGFNTTSMPNKVEEYDVVDDYMKFFSWNASVGATYTMDIATFSGKVSMKNAGFNGNLDEAEEDYEKAYKNAVNAVVLGLEIEAKTEALIPGAELSLKYAADDLLGSYNDAYRTAEELSKFGSVTAKCKVSF